MVDAGTAQVLYGSAGGLTTAGSQTFHSDFLAGMPDSAITEDALGKALATGDFDGNGTDDLAIGMPGEGLGAQPQAGAVTVLYGLDRATGAFGIARFGGAAMSVSEYRYGVARRVRAGSRSAGGTSVSGSMLCRHRAKQRTTLSRWAYQIEEPSGGRVAHCRAS